MCTCGRKCAFWCRIQYFPSQVLSARWRSNVFHLFLHKVIHATRLSPYTVVQVYDGPAALQALSESEAGPFDCMLLDLCMPVMDGFQVAKAVRCVSFFLSCRGLPREAVSSALRPSITQGSAPVSLSSPSIARLPIPCKTQFHFIEVAKVVRCVA